MKTKVVHYIPTGGTIGSATKGDGARDVDPSAQGRILELLQRIPHVRYSPVQVQMRGDSSAHPRVHLLDLVGKALDHANSGEGMIVSYGTDTMNLATSTIALAGNEVWRYPVVALGSIKGPEKKNSDAPYNTITAGFFAAYGNGSGVFAVRPNGVIITSRHDTPGGSVDWHGRGIPQAEKAFFARVALDKLIDQDCNITFDFRRRKHRNLRAELEQLIEYQRQVEDGTLDSPDEVVVGGRGRLPNLSILGLGMSKITNFKRRPTDDTVERVLIDMNALVGEQKLHGRLVGKVIQQVALLEHVRRHKEKESHLSDSARLAEKWESVMEQFFRSLLGNKGYFSYEITRFWKKYSGIRNDQMDFTGIVSFDVSSDPELLYRAFQTVPPRGLILKATGASGMRLRDDFGESYRPLLTYCRDGGIPVVLTSSSRGEVTSFEYGPGLELLEQDLCFFAGTMDSDLVQPRMALLNSAENRTFLGQLVDKLDVADSVKTQVRRNIYRQLLSGSHYRRHEGEGQSDRKRVESLYQIETRVDLLTGIHVRKAVLASYLHEISQRKLNLPEGIETI